MSEQFRTCPDTGLLIHRPAESLMKANAVAAVVFLLIGGIYGLMVGLTRWPAVHLLPADWFYLTLTSVITTAIVSAATVSLRRKLIISRCLCQKYRFPVPEFSIRGDR